MDKSKPWSRSIEDLHRGSNLPSPVGNSISRSGRHSTLRYGTGQLGWEFSSSHQECSHLPWEHLPRGGIGGLRCKVWKDSSQDELRMFPFSKTQHFPGASRGLPPRVLALPAAPSFPAAMDRILDSLERPHPSPNLLSPSHHSTFDFQVSLSQYSFFFQFDFWRRQDHFPGLVDNLSHSLDVPLQPGPSAPSAVTQDAAQILWEFFFFLAFKEFCSIIL